MIIFESLLNTFEASIFFWGNWGRSKKSKFNQVEQVKLVQIHDTLCKKLTWMEEYHTQTFCAYIFRIDVSF